MYHTWITGTPAERAAAARPFTFSTTFCAVAWAGGRDGRVSVSGRNLLVVTGSNYTGMDPEVSNFGIQPVARNIEVAQYPRSRSFWFTLSVGF